MFKKLNYNFFKNSIFLTLQTGRPCNLYESNFKQSILKTTITNSTSFMVFSCKAVGNIVEKSAGQIMFSFLLPNSFLQSVFYCVGVRGRYCAINDDVFSTK